MSWAFMFALFNFWGRLDLTLDLLRVCSSITSWSSTCLCSLEADAPSIPRGASLHCSAVGVAVVMPYACC